MFYTVYKWVSSSAVIVVVAIQPGGVASVEGHAILQTCPSLNLDLPNSQRLQIFRFIFLARLWIMSLGNASEFGLVFHLGLFDACTASLSFVA